MGEIKTQPPVLLFAAITFNARVELQQVINRLEDAFGPVEHRSPIFDFDSFTDYYEPEMGTGLQKCFVSFQNLIQPEKLPEIKRLTNQMELEISGGTKRNVNIDPGYLNVSKMVLATTKDYTHRLYLGQGIFGDVHFIFQKKSFQVQPWTYPDYQQPFVITFFNDLRERYREKLSER